MNLKRTRLRLVPALAMLVLAGQEAAASTAGRLLLEARQLARLERERVLT
jgi:hypothetical protein